MEITNIEITEKTKLQFKWMNGFVWGILVGGIIVIISFILTFYISPVPMAIDVYRNKTELNIRYENGIPLDSTVIFKTKAYEE